MLFLEKRQLTTVADLQRWLLGAVRLELSTIPPYLTALYSLKPGTNTEISEIIRSVALQEMLHMALACNILNAVGGTPSINAPAFHPNYPGPLPMSIGTEPGKPFIVPLRRFSMALVEKIFMTIEEPEHALDFPGKREMLAASSPDYHTIGEFYEAIKREIIRFGDGIFIPNRNQVTGWFPDLIAVNDVATAVTAIDTIVQQGEGTSTSPVSTGGGLAHYYRFSEIVHGKRLVQVPSVGFAYCGAEIPFDPDGVFPMVDNPSLVNLPQNSTAVPLANQFDDTYTALLNALNTTFNSDPSQLNVSIGLMYALRLQAQQLMEIPIGGGVTAGPRWFFASGAAGG